MAKANLWKRRLQGLNEVSAGYKPLTEMNERLERLALALGRRARRVRRRQADGREERAAFRRTGGCATRGSVWIPADSGAGNVEEARRAIGVPPRRAERVTSTEGVADGLVGPAPHALGSVPASGVRPVGQHGMCLAQSEQVRVGAAQSPWS
jgi:hypothetical protein